MLKKDLEDESLCTKCGICCYVTYHDEHRTLFYTPFACVQLKCQSCECKVYDTRQEVVSNCVNARKAYQLRVLPDNCPYVRNAENYKGPQRDYRDSDAVRSRVENILKKDGPIYHLKGIDCRLDFTWTPEKMRYKTEEII